MPTSNRSRRLGALLVLAAALSFVATEADARAGRGGGGFGSRGSRTFDSAPATNTAPRAAAPIERSAAPQPGRPGSVAQGAQRPATAGGFFGRNGGMMGGLLGAGLFGMLLGYGFAGGLGGLGSIIGLLLQVALVVILARLAWGFFQRRQQPAVAGGAPLQRDATGGATPPRQQGGGGGLGGLGGLAGRARRGNAKPRDEVGIGQADLNEFDRLLGEVQAAYGREDGAALREAATPEMATYFEQEFAENAARGVVNRIGEVRLLQGDLAESWREAGRDYATVAMRFSIVDWTVERAGAGKLVEGDPERPSEATEVWTFVRPSGGRWQLSAIQQA